MTSRKPRIVKKARKPPTPPAEVRRWRESLAPVTQAELILLVRETLPRLAAQAMREMDLAMREKDPGHPFDARDFYDWSRIVAESSRLTTVITRFVVRHQRRKAN